MYMYIHISIYIKCAFSYKSLSIWAVHSKTQRQSQRTAIKNSHTVLVWIAPIWHGSGLYLWWEIWKSCCWAQEERVSYLLTNEPWQSCSWNLQGKEAPIPSWSHFSLVFLGFHQVCDLFQGRVPFFHWIWWNDSSLYYLAPYDQTLPISYNQPGKVYYFIIMYVYFTN